jgi:hypothetical protein
MGFFDEIIDAAWLTPRANRTSDPPPWLGPPHDVVPAHVATDLEIVQTSDLAVWISGAAVFPSGVNFELQVRWCERRQIQLPLMPGVGGRDGLCLGVLFDDGRRLLATPRRLQSSQSAPSQSMVVAPLRARPHFATSEIWLWPLPKDSLTWVLEWRGQRIGESLARLEMETFADAARRARPVWPERHRERVT